jgi:hypothetical protein
VKLWLILAALVLSSPALAVEEWIVEGYDVPAGGPSIKMVDLSTGTQLSGPWGSVGSTESVTINGRSDQYEAFNIILGLTSAGHPYNGCQADTFLVVFEPLGQTCTIVSSGCRYQIVKRGGECPTPKSGGYTYATAVAAGQGITQAVLDHYAADGELPIKWIQLDRSESMDFSVPDSTTWSVYFYAETAGVPGVRCTVDTNSDPASALPSSSHCP